jgi:hypothetical protein
VIDMAVNVVLGALLAASVAWSGGRAAPTQTPQTAAPRPALSGTWSLNLEESSASSDVASTAPTPPPPDPPPQPVGPGLPTDGVGRPSGFNDPGKSGSLLPQNLTNAINSSQPKDTGHKLTDHERLLLELTTPPSRLVIASTADSVTVTHEGRTDTYLVNGKVEKHKLVNGSIKTKTYWTDSALRQEIDAGEGLKLLRTFQVDDHGRLVVISRPADDKSLEFETTLVSRLGTADASKGRKRAVYDVEAK